MRKINITASIILIIFSSAYLCLAFHLPSRNLQGSLDSSFMPKTLAYSFFILCLILLAKNIATSPKENCDYKISKKEISGLIILLFAGIVYMKSVCIVGFLFATPPFMAILMIASGSRRWSEICITSIFAPVIIYFFFEKLFNIRLPGCVYF